MSWKKSLITTNKIYLTLILFLIIRFTCSIFFGDKFIDHEWGTILDNYFNKGVFGFFEFKETITPNLYMPPLYAIFLISLKSYISDLGIFLISVYLTQSIMAILSAYYFYKLLNIFFSEKISFFCYLIFLSFPLNIYAVAQISSIVLQMTFFIIFLYYSIIFLKEEKFKYIYYVSILAGFLILLRGEFIAIYFVFSLIVLKKKFLNFVILMIIPLIIISPYLKRNLDIFDKFTITKSFGYNLWKGNNNLSRIEGNSDIFPKNLDNDLKNINDTQKHDLIRDNIFKKYAFENIFNNPEKYTYMFIKKIFAFMFFDPTSTYPNYFSPIHIIPKIILSITTIFGIYYYDKKNIYLNYVLMIYFFYIFLFSAFFILPRYSLAILPFQIILSGAFLKKITEKYK